MNVIQRWVWIAACCTALLMVSCEAPSAQSDGQSDSQVTVDDPLPFPRKHVEEVMTIQLQKNPRHFPEHSSYKPLTYGQAKAEYDTAGALQAIQMRHTYSLLNYKGERWQYDGWVKLDANLKVQSLEQLSRKRQAE